MLAAGHRASRGAGQLADALIRPDVQTPRLKAPTIRGSGEVTGQELPNATNIKFFVMRFS